MSEIVNIRRTWIACGLNRYIDLNKVRLVQFVRDVDPARTVLGAIIEFDNGYELKIDSPEQAQDLFNNIY